MKIPTCILALLFSLCIGCTNPQSVRYLALGDSITGRYGDETYPEFLVPKLGATRFKFEPDAEGGRTSTEGRLRFQEITATNEFPNLMVFIYFLGGAELIDFMKFKDPFVSWSPNDPEFPFTNGLNDVLDNIRGNTRSVLTLAADLSYDTYVVLYHDLVPGKFGCLVFDLPMTVAQASRASEYVAMLNTILEEESQMVNATVISLQDINGLLQADIKENFDDCIHPDEEGHKIIATHMAGILPHCDDVPGCGVE